MGIRLCNVDGCFRIPMPKTEHPAILAGNMTDVFFRMSCWTSIHNYFNQLNHRKVWSAAEKYLTPGFVHMHMFVLALPEISSAFDTSDHSIFVHSLYTNFELTDIVLH